MTNAQAALQAAAVAIHRRGWIVEDIPELAGVFKDWLDEQDEIDRKKNQVGATRTYGEV